MKMCTMVWLAFSLVGISHELTAISNPFKKNDPAARWQTFREAFANYVHDTKITLDVHAAKKTSKSGVFSSKPDPEKRFKELQIAFDELLPALKSDSQKTKSIADTVRKEIVQLRGQDLEELRLVESLLMRRQPGMYDRIKGFYEANEKKMPASIRVTAQNVYPFLGLTPEQGYAASIDDVNNRLKTMRGTMGGSIAERDSLFRQLGWYFQSPYSKQEFDAFLKGSLAMKNLELSPDVITKIQNLFLHIPDIVMMLTDIDELVKK